MPHPSTSSAYGIWSLNEVRDAVRGENWPEPFTIPFAGLEVLHLEAENFSGSTWTATVGPDFTANGNVASTTVGGFPAITFDGSGDYFYTSSITVPSNASMFVVAVQNSGPLIIEQTTNGNTAGGFYFYTNNGNPYNVSRSTPNQAIRFNTSGDWWLNSPDIKLGSFNFDPNNSSFDLRLNNSNISAPLAGGSYANWTTNYDDTDEMWIGARAGSLILFTGEVLEFLICGTMDAQTYNDTCSYFMTKYGLS